MSDLTTKAAEIRAGLVADWRKAMEGVTLGPWTMEVESSDPVHESEEDRQPEVYVCSSGTQCDYTVVATMGRAESIPHMRKSFDASWIARCSPAGIASLLALIEQQAAELAERHERYSLDADELLAVAGAIGSVRFMDPPDGGDVSLAEQVKRMREALTTAESERDELLREKERLGAAREAGDECGSPFCSCAKKGVCAHAAKEGMTDG